MKIAGVVVLYNPDESVIGNINSYIKDLELLYVFDNSEVKNELIEKLKKINKVKYFSVGKNVGIGFALNYVCDIAVKEGYDWLLTMDHDSYFEPNGVLKMIGEFEKKIGRDKEKIGVISPLIV
jgi:rhamnosyltransferase